MVNAPEVKVGQIWADNDPRAEGRTVEVVELWTNARGDAKATVRVVTNRAEDQKRIDEARKVGHVSKTGRYVRGVGWVPDDTRGKARHILVRRMRPTSTGYRLVRDVTP